jgi:hypothetical protein
VKKEKVHEKGFMIAKIPSIKGFPPKEARDNNKLWPRKIPSIEGFPPKKARDNNKLWPRKIPSTKGFPPESSHYNFEKTNV